MPGNAISHSTPGLGTGLVSSCATSCEHCGGPIVGRGNSSFCCEGCQTVHGLLQDLSLHSVDDRRAWQAYQGLKPKPLPSHLRALDQPDSRSAYIWDSGDSKKDRFRFFIEGIHCTGCLWILERLPAFNPTVMHARLNLAESTLTVEVAKGQSPTSALASLYNLGYRGIPLESQQDYHQHLQKQRREAMKRIGVAAFATGNIMLFSVSIYAGATGPWAQWFDFIAAGLFLPVLTYSAAPIIRSGFRRLSLDLPIALALLAGAALSYANLFLRQGQVYFDSLSMLVFLLLGSRLLFSSFQERWGGMEHLISSWLPKFARTPAGDWVATSTLKAGDQIAVFPQEQIPTDGPLLSSVALINEACLTGEARPVTKTQGEACFQGAINAGTSPILVQVSEVGSGTRIGSILKRIQEGSIHRPKILHLADNVGIAFTLIVLAGAFFVGFATGDLSRSLALVVVTCPCVFGFALPMVFLQAQSMALGQGAIVKTSAVWDRLANIKNILFDKTGTITTNTPMVQSIHILPESPFLKEQVLAVARKLESTSTHPIAQAIRHFTDPSADLSVDSQDTTDWEMSADTTNPDQLSCVQKHRGRPIAHWRFVEQTRPGATEAIRDLKSRGYPIHVLSGDSLQALQALKLPLAKSSLHGRLTPEEKLKWTQDTPSSLFIGDGNNDAAALAAGSVGIAVEGAIESSLQGSSIALTKPSLAVIPWLLDQAQWVKKMSASILAISVSYNVIAAGLAVTGQITPLWAAIIMPTSSLTIFTFLMIFSWRRRSALGRGDLL